MDPTPSSPDAKTPAPVGPAPPPSEGTRRRRWVPWVRDAVLVLLVVLAVRAYQQRDALEGEAPTFRARTVDGAELGLGDLRGRPVAIHFWATWCGVCRAMESNVVGLAHDRPDAVVTIASRSGDARALRAWLAEHDLVSADGSVAMRVIPDPNGDLAVTFGVQAFPTTFYLDAEGKVRTVEVGYTTALGLRARLFWAGL